MDNRETLGPARYVMRFCAEVGAPVSDGVVRERKAIGRQTRGGPKRMLFPRLYRYRGQAFVVRAYERILDRGPTEREIRWAQEAFFYDGLSRSALMLKLGFSPEGRAMQGYRVRGLGFLRVLWNLTHSREHRIWNS
jgi:hypothetical protein